MTTLCRELPGMTEGSERLKTLFSNIGFIWYRYVKGISSLLYGNRCSC